MLQLLQCSSCRPFLTGGEQQICGFVLLLAAAAICICCCSSLHLLQQMGCDIPKCLELFCCRIVQHSNSSAEETQLLLIEVQQLLLLLLLQLLLLLLLLLRATWIVGGTRSLWQV